MRGPEVEAIIQCSPNGLKASRETAWQAYLGINEIFFGVDKGLRQLDPPGQR
jgi:hypothetical protein